MEEKPQALESPASSFDVGAQPVTAVGPESASSESASGSTETAGSAKEKARLADFFKEAWSQALLKVSAAEDEAAKVLHRAGDLAGWKPEDVKRLAKEFSERLTVQRKEFEKSLDDGIHRAISRVKIPRRDDLEALVRRLDQVEARIEALRQKRS